MHMQATPSQAVRSVQVILFVLAKMELIPHPHSVICRPPEINT